MDAAPLVRALRRLVYTDKILSLEVAWAYCDIVGIARAELDPKLAA